MFRERDSGNAVAFDALVSPAQPAGQDGTVTVTRRYRAAHNLGCFRFVEYSALDAAGDTVGDITLLAEILVPFDPELRDGRDLSGVVVHRQDAGPEVVETVHVDANGITSIEIEIPEHGYRTAIEVTR